VSSSIPSIVVEGTTVRTSVSIGIAHLWSSDALRRPPRRRRQAAAARLVWAGASTRAATAQLLLHTADTAMYAAEKTGKGRAVLAEAVTDVPRCSPR